MKMKSKLGISLMICTLILSSSPLPLVAAEVSNSSEQPATEQAQSSTEQKKVNTGEEKNSQPSTTSENLPSADETKTEETSASSTEESTTENNQAEENNVIDDSQEIGDDEYIFNEDEQQKNRDLAMSILDDMAQPRMRLFSMARASEPTIHPFIQEVAPHARRLGQEYNLYASVMIAQAILESGWGNSTLSQAPNYNYFGIKGSFNGQSVLYPTKEYLNGKWVTVNAKFRKYPSPYESMRDNANLLRKGINGSPSFYSGAWKEKTKSYEDATKWLTGRYATDPDYASKLNATIRANNLTQYDSKETNPNNNTITSNTPVNKGMKIANNSYFIYTAPYNTPDSYRNGQLNAAFTEGQRVDVTNYAVTSAGIRTYYIKNIGWVDYRALSDYDTIASQTTVNKNMRTANLAYYIYNRPVNTDGANRGELLSSQYALNQQVRVTSEAVTSRGIKTLYLDGVGWVDARALKSMPTFSEQKRNQQMRIANGYYYFYNLPYNTDGAARTSRINEKLANNTQVTVVKSATTSEGIEVYYIDKYGWVDAQALKAMPTAREKDMNQQMRIANANYFIYNKPYNTLGAERVARLNTKLANNTQVTVKKSATTSEGIEVYYIDNIGWVDAQALQAMPTFTEKTVNQQMRVANANYYLYNKPYNTLGAERVTLLRNKFANNEPVQVTKTGVTSQGIDVYYIQNIGWVDARALKNPATYTETTINQQMRVTNAYYYLYNKPYNSAGAARVTLLVNKVSENSQVRVTKQAKTSEDVDVYYIDKLGWVDARALNIEKDPGESEKFKKVQTLLNSKYNSSNYGIQVSSLVDESSASINPNMKFTAASTGKLPAIYYTQKQINAGKLKPQAKYKYVDAINTMRRGNTGYSYMRGGAGTLQYKNYGQDFSIDQILNWTIYYSDNQGANFLGYYAAKQYDTTMRNDISNIIGRTWENPFTITAAENAKLMAAIYKQGGQANQYLKNTVFDNERIPKYLPVQVGHKVGDVYDNRHDIAIVYANKPYVLSVMTKNYITYEQISKMSLEIYNLLK